MGRYSKVSKGGPRKSLARKTKRGVRSPGGRDSRAADHPVAALKRQLKDAAQQDKATSEVLRIISRSTGDLRPVFATILANAVQVCDANNGVINRWDGNALHLIATHKMPPEFTDLRTRSPYRPNQHSPSGRMLATDGVRLIAPVIMDQPCVNCHNSHPESPKTDWKVGDVRGIQEVSISQPIAGNIFAFKYLLAYFGLTAAVGTLFITMQRRQAATISGMNAELEAKNDFLDSLSTKISRYLSPQIYRSIFSGQKDVTIHTERKKLTIFFSDIQDFTGITERLQPEQITRLLNDYFTEMSKVALAHGGTIDKFIGDAMLVFFGDPETRGDAEDAKACLRMAIEMQHRIAGLNAAWRQTGIEDPFRVRMGINTGFCNVGNFGSNDRMDYTII